MVNTVEADHRQILEMLVEIVHAPSVDRITMRRSAGASEDMNAAVLTEPVARRVASELIEQLQSIRRVGSRLMVNRTVLQWHPPSYAGISNS